MPDSSGGKKEAEQEEMQEEQMAEEEKQEELEAEGKEHPLMQQEEEQMVKRRITVRMGPVSKISWSVSSLYPIQRSFETVKVYTITVASEKRMLRQVAFTENVISTSLCELRLLQHHFVLDSNEKKVNIGKSKREG